MLVEDRVIISILLTAMFEFVYKLVQFILLPYVPLADISVIIDELVWKRRYVFEVKHIFGCDHCCKVDDVEVPNVRGHIIILMKQKISYV